MSSDDRARVLLVGFGPTTRSALDGLIVPFDVIGLVRDAEDEVTRHARACGVAVDLLTSRAEISARIAQLRPDCVVVSSYNRIFPAAVVDLCPFVNVHYAPLPRYRGRANVNWAIINHEAHAAVTVHSLTAGLDAGGVLAQELVPIEPRDTVATLYDRLNAVQARILPLGVERRLRGDLGDDQDEDDATYGCARLPEDGEIDWSGSTRDIDALVRALGGPYPEAYTYLGLERVSIVSAEPSPDTRVFAGRVPGRVVGWSAGEGWTDVLTGDGILRIHRVRTHDDDRPAADLLGSSQLTLGLRNADLLQRIEALEARVAGSSSGTAPQLD
jgi:methionyl-tRNA formyltransferase